MRSGRTSYKCSGAGLRDDGACRRRPDRVVADAGPKRQKVQATLLCTVEVPGLVGEVRWSAACLLEARAAKDMIDAGEVLAHTLAKTKQLWFSWRCGFHTEKRVQRVGWVLSWCLGVLKKTSGKLPTGGWISEPIWDGAWGRWLPTKFVWDWIDVAHDVEHDLLWSREHHDSNHSEIACTQFDDHVHVRWCEDEKNEIAGQCSCHHEIEPRGGASSAVMPRRSPQLVCSHVSLAHNDLAQHLGSRERLPKKAWPSGTRSSTPAACRVSFFQWPCQFSMPTKHMRRTPEKTVCESVG